MTQTRWQKTSSHASHWFAARDGQISNKRCTHFTIDSSLFLGNESNCPVCTKYNLSRSSLLQRSNATAIRKEISPKENATGSTVGVDWMQSNILLLGRSVSLFQFAPYSSSIHFSQSTGLGLGLPIERPQRLRKSAGFVWEYLEYLPAVLLASFVERKRRSVSAFFW